MNALGLVRTELVRTETVRTEMVRAELPAAGLRAGAGAPGGPAGPGGPPSAEQAASVTVGRLTPHARPDEDQWAGSSAWDTSSGAGPAAVRAAALRAAAVRAPAAGGSGGAGTRWLRERSTRRESYVPEVALVREAPAHLSYQISSACGRNGPRSR